MNLSNRHCVLCILLSVIYIAGCTAGLTGGNSNFGPGTGLREVALDEEFKLAQEETVSVGQTKLIVQLKSVRRTWYVDGKSETVDAEVLATLEGKEQRQWISFKNEMRIGAFIVSLTAANPFGKSTATLIVRRA